MRKIGGTAISGIIGTNPYKTPLDVYQDLVEGKTVETNDAMRRGVRLEPFLRSEFEANYGKIYMLADELDAMGIPWHKGPRGDVVATPKQHDFMSASLDDIGSFAGETVVVEYKTAGVNVMHQWGEVGTDAVPSHYKAQAAWYMAATGLNKTVLLAMVAGDFRHYIIRRDMEFEKLLLAAGARFWNEHILPMSPPPVDGSEAWSERLDTIQRTGMSAGTPEQVKALDNYLRAKEILDAAQKAERKFKNELVASLGTSEGFMADEIKVTYKPQSRASVDWEAFKKARGVHDSELKAFEKRSSYYVLRTNGGGK